MTKRGFLVWGTVVCAALARHLRVFALFQRISRYVLNTLIHIVKIAKILILYKNL